MSQEHLRSIAEDVPGLLALLIVTMPDCLLYDSWIKEGSDWHAEDVASYFGDLFRSNREGLKALNSWSADMQVTIESPEHMIILREVRSDFVYACVFEREAPLGRVRLMVRRLNHRLEDFLPSFEVEERPRGVRVVEFLNRYAPDPHAVLLRTSLRSGLPMDLLESPERMGPEQVEALEATAREILGLQSLNL